MNLHAPIAAARDAVAPHPERPATAILHDSPDARLVVFRLAPGQRVAPHQSSSTVTLSVLQGSGLVSGAEGEREVEAGALVVYAPDELHGMRAVDTELLLLATITPRPGQPRTPLATADHPRDSGAHR
jgi:quercetin dioxygenase-like cupin family protein